MPGPDGLSPHEVYRRVTDQAHDLVAEQYALLNDVILPALAQEGHRSSSSAVWTEAQRPGSATTSCAR
jgi:polyphosphate kinase